MDLTIDEIHAEKLIEEIMLELMSERQDLFYEAIEEIGLAEAIRYS